MLGTTQKQINNISYCADYPFENCAARFDAREGKFYFKLYGQKENELDLGSITQMDFVMDAIRFGDEMTAREYEKRSLMVD